MPINSSITQLVQITTTPGDETVTAAKVVDGSLGINELANACISGGKLSANSVLPGHIFNSCISGNTIAANAIVPSGHLALVASSAKTVADNNYTVVKSDRGKVIKCDASGGAFTILLDACSTLGNGFEVTFIKTNADAVVGGNTVTIDANSSETIDGALTNVLCAKYSHITIVTDGSEWFVKSANDFIYVPDTGFSDVGAASDTYFDEESISCPPGDWEITGSVGYYSPGTTTRIVAGIGTNSGTSSDGLEEGLSSMLFNMTGTSHHVNVCSVRKTPAATTPYYLKVMVTWTGSTPQTAGRIQARRFR